MRIVFEISLKTCCFSCIIQSWGTGILDETALDSCVTFASAEHITDVAFELLSTQETRWRIEQKCIRLMIQENFEAEVLDVSILEGDGENKDSTEGNQLRPSSLSLLANALNNLAGNSFNKLHVNLYPF